MAVRGAMQRLQDTVHGLMEFRGLEASLIDVLRAGELQRLRRIRQLGLVHLVFPSAEHSRLVHSMGAAHVALRFVRRLEHCTREFLAPALIPDEESRRDLALAALVHDIGHGPLSHVWEREVVPNFDPNEWAAALGLPAEQSWGSGKIKWHELVGQAVLLNPDTDIHQILESQESGLAERIARMLRGEYHLSYLPSLLSGDVDVDRCDFVLRDAVQAGVQYGHFDLSWLISVATVGVAHKSDLVVGFDKRKAPRVIEQFLVARRALYETVYRHKTTRSAEGMVGNFLRRMIDLSAEGTWPANKPNFVSYQRALSGEPIGVADLMELDDYSLWGLLRIVEQRDKDPIAADLARRVTRRDLFKRVPVESDEVADYLGRHDRSDLAPAIEEKCGVQDGRYYLVIDRFPFDTISMEDADAVYLVDEPGDGPGDASLARDHPDLRHLTELKTSPQAIYAPVEAIDALVELVRS